MKTIRSAGHRVLLDLLTEWFDETDMSQHQFAAALGKERGYVKRVLEGDQIPNGLELRRWAIACGRTPRSLWWHLEFRLERLPHREQ